MQFDANFVHTTVPKSRWITGEPLTDIQVSIDTRTLKKGDLFVALSGAHDDGHAYIVTALEQGACGFMAAESWWHKHKDDAGVCGAGVIIIVPDTYAALYELARAWRLQFTYPVVGITGSVGKTSTKELLAALVKHDKRSFLVSPGNHNTALGIALTMLRMRAHHDGALFEVGISMRGEMAQLARFLEPTTAIITGIGHAHMEGLGSIADIATEKRAIFSHFPEMAIGIVNGDQALLADVAYPHPVIKFGTKTRNQIQARKIRIGERSVQFVLKIYADKYRIELNSPHYGAVMNALAATAVACHLGVSSGTIVAGLQEPTPVPGRFEMRSLKAAQGVLINDCYNANPESVKAALLALHAMKKDVRKIVVLGDMLELGAESSFWHRQIGRFLRKVTSLNHVILVGSHVRWTKKTAPLGLSVETADSWREAKELLAAHLDDDAVILVKGSRGMQLDALVRHFS